MSFSVELFANILKEKKRWEKIIIHEIDLMIRLRHTRDDIDSVGKSQLFDTFTKCIFNVSSFVFSLSLIYDMLFYLFFAPTHIINTSTGST